MCRCLPPAGNRYASNILDRSAHVALPNAVLGKTKKKQETVMTCSLRGPPVFASECVGPVLKRLSEPS